VANSSHGVAAVTVGATEGIFAVISALVNPGEEVIMLEPFYDAYPTDTILNEGVPVYVPLRPPKVPKGTITSGTRAVSCACA
jgi:aspartate/methionine/tyrosine aminotransferase